ADNQIEIVPGLLEPGVQAFIDVLIPVAHRPRIERGQSVYSERTTELRPARSQHVLAIFVFRVRPENLGDIRSASEHATNGEPCLILIALANATSRLCAAASPRRHS